ncbi:MAG TPA: hypothetical protein VG672_20860 [Bryobacteraceae bacterium]|nr:hypothetical protein [Bryobacteraceae bacterium]
MPALIVKLADLAPEATVTEAGVVTRLLLSESVTTEPPEGAVPFSVNVQVLEAFDVRLFGLQVRLEGTRDGCKVNEVDADVLLSEAVTVAV